MLFQNLKTYFREHGAAFFCSVFVGIIMIAPQIIFIINADSGYNGLPILKTDAEVQYVSRMKEFLDNRGNGSPYSYEDRNTISTFNTISEAILASPALIFPINVVQLNLFYKFFFPALIFLLAYHFLLKVLKDKRWAIVGALAILLGQNLTSISDIFNLIKLNPVYYNFLSYSRPIHPEFSSVFFFLLSKFIYITFHFSIKRKQIKRGF